MSRFARRQGPWPALFSLVVLFGCEAAGTLAGGGTQSDYLVARQALETGNYDLAIRRYGALMSQLDPVSASRVQLEYAHALLRGNRFDEAIAAADTLISARDGAIQASALAVRGTARHERARMLMAEGGEAGAIRTLLIGAQQDLASVTANHAELDQTGSMQSRLRLVRADLAAAA